MNNGDSDIWADIDLAYSGWETTTPSSSWETDYGWWTVGLAVDCLSRWITIPYLGSLIGFIPLLYTSPTCPSYTQSTGCLSSGVWANGTSIDPSGNSDANGTNWGTMTMLFTVYLVWHGTTATRTFNVDMEAWLHETNDVGGNWQIHGIPFTTPLSFSLS